MPNLQDRLTAHQAKYFANELRLRRAADDSQKLTAALMDAVVDLNPHQVDAALFAFKSPLSKGAILADEVGLGKTIEAGLVMTQKWAEGKRRILVISPASLRPQWRNELAEKFFLPGEIIESASFEKAIKKDIANPFDRSGQESTVLICSFHFAANKHEELLGVPWDLVVIDEAHRLRNVYKTDNKIGRKIRGALVDVPKILLTATPLQNSLMELYGLASFIDEHAFGDVKTFRSKYSKVANDATFNDLKSRLAPICHRTLRRQVTEYVKYTNRIPLTQEFTPSDDEQSLYDLVSEYLRRPDLYSLPAAQRSLITLVMRKLLASSTFAIAGGLESMVRRLSETLKVGEKQLEAHDSTTDLTSDLDHFQSLSDEWTEGDDNQSATDTQTVEELRNIKSELVELEALRDQAISIRENAKGEALLQALKAAFEKATDLGAQEKAVVFTESRRTQRYLVELLAKNGYADDLVLFNGSNDDDGAKQIYKNWVAANEGSDRVTGTRAADMRAALVDEFRNTSKILIATEAAAEGINLQFCSIVVNYDLPWNPQRIEQRIGRCHRYGQKHDVVVVNFLNRDNAADQRVFELLDEKFELFSGVFGASDEVLGAIESGVDIERRIVDIYQRCRQPEEIDDEFTQLQLELDEQITAVMQDTRRKLLENFDAEVHDRLKANLTASNDSIGRAEELLWRLSKHILNESADFDDDARKLVLTSSLPEAQVSEGDTFQLGNAAIESNTHKYRLAHPLARHVQDEALESATPNTTMQFNYSEWASTAVALEPYVGQRGWLIAEKLSISGGDIEEHLILAAVNETGDALTSDAVRRMMELPSEAVKQLADVPGEESAVRQLVASQRQAILGDLEQRKSSWFDAEIDKFEQWAEDQRHALKSQLNELDAQIKDIKKQARMSGSLPDKLALQRKVRDLETRRDEAWRAYDQNTATVEDKKDNLLDQVETRLTTDVASDELFTVKWELI